MRVNNMSALTCARQDEDGTSLTRQSTDQENKQDNTNYKEEEMERAIKIRNFEVCSDTMLGKEFAPQFKLLKNMSKYIYCILANNAHIQVMFLV